MNLNPAVVMVLRKTGLGLDEIRELTPGQFVELVGELRYQDELERWEAANHVAGLRAALYNMFRGKDSKPMGVLDLIGPPPTRDGVEAVPEREVDPITAALQLAREKGLRVPEYRLSRL